MRELLQQIRVGLADNGSVDVCSRLLPLLDQAIDKCDRYCVQLVHIETGQIAGTYAPEHIGGDSLEVCSRFVTLNTPLLTATALRIARAS